jgi:hypothetical protein
VATINTYLLNTCHDSNANTSCISQPQSILYHNIAPIRKKVLVLDLDETLIHSTTGYDNRALLDRFRPRVSSQNVFRRHMKVYDMKLKVALDKSGTTTCEFYITKRPFVETFLAMVRIYISLNDSSPLGL